MNREQFLNYIKSPETLDKNSINELKELIDEYPYFQTSHLLYVKSLHNHQNIKYNNQLKLTAAYVGDRSALYQLIYNTPYQDQVIEQEQEEMIVEESLEIKEVIEAKSEALPQETTPQDKKALANVVLARIQEIKEERARKKAAQEQEESQTIAEIKTETQTEQDIVVEEPAETDTSFADIILQTVNDHKTPVSLIKQEIEQKEEIETQSEVEQEEHPYIPYGLGEVIIESLSTEVEKETQSEDSANIILKTPAKEEQTEAKEEAIGDLVLKSIFSDKKPVAKKTKKESPFQFDFEKKHSAEAKDPMADYLEEACDNLNKKELLKIEEVKEQTSEFDLIDSFLQNDPRMTPRPTARPAQQEDISTSSVVEKENYITETLAKIYIKQGLYSKAISTYEKLCLKYPKKNSYFVQQIEKVKAIINN